MSFTGAEDFLALGVLAEFNSFKALTKFNLWLDSAFLKVYPIKFESFLDLRFLSLGG